MVTPSPGATTQIAFSRLMTDVTDGKGKVVKFKQVENSQPPRFEAKGTDGNTYYAGLDDVMVNITVFPERDLKADRKAGRPIPKDQAKQIDEELKREKEEEEKAAEGPAGSKEAEAILRTSTMEPSEQEKQRREAENRGAGRPKGR